MDDHMIIFNAAQIAERIEWENFEFQKLRNNETQCGNT